MRILPGGVLGIVYGEGLRWVTAYTDTERYDFKHLSDGTLKKLWFLFFETPHAVIPNGQYHEVEILTHLQYKSRWGIYLTLGKKSWCFHAWYLWRKKQTDPPLSSTWVPGSEQGIYFRTPGYRWDYELGMTWTWGFFGLHTD